MSSPSLAIGNMLGHYRIVERIGAGGMGVVYRAHDERLQRDVAVKVLSAATLASHAGRKQFRQEALTLSRLNHPNIATVFDFDTENGTDYLVIEYISGITLDTKLAARALPEKEVVSLALQLCQGLEAAHKNGIIHGDLKPSNLQITADDRLKILDFGLARWMPHASELGLTVTVTATQTYMGTLPYMAPEQLRGASPDVRSDTWAVGAVIYEMATGKPPFIEATSSLLADAILNKEPASPTSVSPLLSSGLEKIILTALKKDCARRYQSSHALAADLQRVEVGLSPYVAAAAAERSKLKRMKLSLVLVGLAVMIALMVGGFRYSQRLQKLTGNDALSFTARADSSEITLLGSIIPPPEKGNAVKIVVEGQKGETSPDEFGRFKLSVNGNAGDRFRLQIYVNGKMAYDDFQVLPGPIAVSLFKPN
ncbi:MAG: serine/threonine-protein kinase [Candidatus Korobacteraceae bacterium]